MQPRLIEDKISLSQLKKLAQEGFGNLVKAVVDVERQIMAIGGELHTDEEAILLKNSSRQENLWGINIYPEKKGKKMIEFDSVINIRPQLNNMSRFVEDAKIRRKIIKIVEKLVSR